MTTSGYPDGSTAVISNNGNPMGIGRVTTSLHYGVVYSISFSAVPGTTTPCTRTFTMGSGEVREVHGDYAAGTCALQ